MTEFETMKKAFTRVCPNQIKILDWNWGKYIYLFDTKYHLIQMLYFSNDGSLEEITSYKDEDF